MTEQQLRDDLARIAQWCHGIAAKAKTQGNWALEATAPRVAEEIDRALAGEPLAYAGPPSLETDQLLTWLREGGHLRDDGGPLVITETERPS